MNKKSAGNKNHVRQNTTHNQNIFIKEYQMKKTIYLTLILFMGCTNPKKSDSMKPNEVHTVDKIESVDNKDVEVELLNLIKQGVIGKWKCDFTGYESQLILTEKEGEYHMEIEFSRKHMKPKIEPLDKKGDKFWVRGSSAKEFYQINSDGNLELRDEKGLFTTARSIMPGVTQIPKSKINLEDVIGQNIFTVAGNYSKSTAKTLEGTNNKMWIVLYDDIGVIFHVDKKNMEIKKARKK